MARSSRRRSTSRSLAVLLLISIASSSVLTNLFHVHAHEPVLPQPITDTDADIDPGAWTHVAPVKNAELTGGDGSVGAGGMGDGEDSRAAQADSLYKTALSLIHSLESHSQPLLSQPPPRPIFSSLPTTPILDFLESTEYGPLATLAKLIRSADVALKKMLGETGGEGRVGPWGLVKKLIGLGPSSSEQRGSAGASWGDKLDTPGTTLTMDELREGASEVVRLLEDSARLGKVEAWGALGEIFLGGELALPQNSSQALKAYKNLADLTGDAQAQNMVGFLHSSNYDQVMGPDIKEGEGDQGVALLYYTFAALGGDPAAEMTVGYRHWAGISTKQSCSDAIGYYKSAADKAIRNFNDGPPGGRHLPPPKLRLSDREGGVYGSGASVSSSSTSHRHPHNHAHHHHHHHHGQMNHHQRNTQQDWDDVLEYYMFHAERGAPDYMFRLGRIHYQGFGGAVITHRPPALGWVGGGNGGGDEEGGRDFGRAHRWFMRIARNVWQRDPPAALGQTIRQPGQATPPSPFGQPAPLPPEPAPVFLLGVYDPAKDAKNKVSDDWAVAAGLAAGYLGRMYLRGEGVPRDYGKAFLWFMRGANQGDRESHNGLGIMFRDGLAVQRDLPKAVAYFQTAASHDLPDAQVNLGKYYIGIGDATVASQYFDLAIRHGDNFQAFYYLAELNAHATANRPDLCPVAVSFYKIVAERGDWEHETWWEAERAWMRGDQRRALLGYWMMAERGYEVAQSNMAWILDRDKQRLRLPYLDVETANATDRLALTYWTRSAAQDNIDALVKMGDYYLAGLGVPQGSSQATKAAACYRSAADTHVSAMAMWNLGWMHENGVGVAKDFHLAKRYYDLALETNSEAYLPVTLALFKLHVRSLLNTFMGGKDIKSLSIFSSKEEKTGQVEGSKEKPGNWWGSMKRVQQEIARRWGGEAGDYQENAFDPTQPEGGDRLAEAQRALEAGEDPVKWARQAREREAAQGRGEGQGQGDQPGGGPDGDLFFDFDEDLLETLAIIGLCLIVGWLVYIRQVRFEAGAARERQAEQARRRAARRLRRNPPAPLGQADQPTPEAPVPATENEAGTTEPTTTAPSEPAGGSENGRERGNQGNDVAPGATQN